MNPLLNHEEHKLSLRKEKIFENLMQKRMGNGSFQLKLDDIKIPEHSLRFYQDYVYYI